MRSRGSTVNTTKNPTEFRGALCFVSADDDQLLVAVAEQIEQRGEHIDEVQIE